MPQQRMDIRMIKDILRLKYSAALSHEAIARSLGISKGVVAKYLGLAGAAGLDWAAVAELDEAGLERRLLGRSTAETQVVEADFARVHIELRRKGVTLMLLWQEYRAAHEGRRTWAYTQFCEHYKAFAKTLKRSMRQHRRAGEKLFIDYAGPTLALADGSRAQVFVAAMGASSYTFACATADQSMRSWLGAMARALSFYGGVPAADRARQPALRWSPTPAATSPSSTRPCATSPATTPSRSFRRARIRPRTRPPPSPRCKSSPAGSWRGCGTRCWPTCTPPTRRSRRCWRR